jgi:hypothetical protein
MRSALRHLPWAAAWIAFGVAIVSLALAQGQEVDGELPARLGLADLAAYRAALAGKAVADDPPSSNPPPSVSFRELWDRSGAWKGRRVRVTGELVRIFRQGPVGSFPALAESWIRTPAGDLLCLVAPLPPPTSPTLRAGASVFEADSRDVSDRERGGLELGRRVAFTGTFLKIVRYPAGDQERLAPLIVGDRPPESISAQNSPEVEGGRSAEEALRAMGRGTAPQNTDRPAAPASAWSPTSWWLVLGLLVVGLAVVLQLRTLRNPGPGRGRRQDRFCSSENSSPTAMLADSPPRFVDSEPSRE